MALDPRQLAAAIAAQSRSRAEGIVSDAAIAAHIERGYGRDELPAGLLPEEVLAAGNQQYFERDGPAFRAANKPRAPRTSKSARLDARDNIADCTAEAAGAFVRRSGLGDKFGVGQFQGLCGRIQDAARVAPDGCMFVRSNGSGIKAHSEEHAAAAEAGSNEGQIVIQCGVTKAGNPSYQPLGSKAHAHAVRGKYSPGGTRAVRAKGGYVAQVGTKGYSAPAMPAGSATAVATRSMVTAVGYSPSGRLLTAANKAVGILFNLYHKATNSRSSAAAGAYGAGLAASLVGGKGSIGATGKLTAQGRAALRLQSQRTKAAVGPKRGGSRAYPAVGGSCKGYAALGRTKRVTDKVSGEQYCAVPTSFGRTAGVSSEDHKAALAQVRGMDADAAAWLDENNWASAVASSPALQAALARQNAIRDMAAMRRRR